MMRSGVLLGGMLVVTCLVAAANPPKQIAGWGQAIDPDGDCKVTAAARQLKIDVPAKLHNLVADTKPLNAPRVLRPVEGTFIAQVRVAGNLNPGQQSTVANSFPYEGAGLLLWQDEGTYVRLERAVIFRDGRVVPYLNFELYKNGQRASSLGAPVPDQPLDLRLERRDGKIFGAATWDGINWRGMPPLTEGLSDKLQIGVVAVSSAAQPFSASFEGFELYRKANDTP